MFNQSLIEIDSLEDIGYEIRRRIKKYGVCIVKDVIPVNECDSIFNEISNTLSYVTQNLEIPFDANNERTWKTLELLAPVKGMIFQNWGLAQMQEIWNVRCDQRIIDIFNDLYRLEQNSDQLLVSFDAFSYLCPPEITGKNWEKENWYHYDQKLKNTEFESIQSWLSVTKTNHDDATLAVMVYSNLLHSQCRKLFSIQDKDDFVMMKDYVREFTERGCIEHRMSCSKGSLVLWDSRTLHYGALPLRNREEQNFRCVIYLCYTPRSYSDKRTLKRKYKIFGQRGKKGYLRTTNHYPHRPVMFPEIHRFADQNLPIVSIDTPVVDECYHYLLGK